MERSHCLLQRDNRDMRSKRCASTDWRQSRRALPFQRSVRSSDGGSMSKPSRKDVKIVNGETQRRI